jgi:hypothetical protein
VRRGRGPPIHFAKEDKMRIANVTSIALLAALFALAVPVLAKSSDTRKAADDASTSASCHAYQQEADGSWTERPCEEKGQPTQTHHRPVAKGSEEEPR